MGTKNNPGEFDVQMRKLADDEPYFILRASDKLAPAAVMCWANMATTHRMNEDKLIEAQECARSMVEWQKANPRQTKIPD